MLDTQEDVPLATMASLLKAAIEDELGSELINGVYNDPRTIENAQGVTLPALCIWRRAQQDVQRDSETQVERITVWFRYTLPMTGLAERGPRWPALPSVWRVISKVMRAGGHASVEDGEDVLELRAATYAIIDTARVLQYGTAEASSANHPEFLAEVQFEHIPSQVDAASFADFLRFYAGFYTPGTDAADMNDATVNDDRLAETRVTIPQP